MNTIQKESFQVLSKYPKGLVVSEFSGAYYKYFGKDLVLSQHGFKKLTSLFNGMKDYIVILDYKGEKVVKVKPEYLPQVAVSRCNNRLEYSAKGSAAVSKASQHGVPKMSSENHNAGPEIMLYKDALISVPIQKHSKKEHSESDLMTKLKDCLQKLMEQHPESVPLSLIRKACPYVYEPTLLNGFPSIKHLLDSLTDVVVLRGIGVQTRIYPAAASERASRASQLI